MRKRIYKTVAVLIAATMLLCDNSIISLAEETDTETVEEVINEGEPEEEIIEEEKTEEEIIEEEKPEEEIIEEEPTEEVIEEEPTEEEVIEEEPTEEAPTEEINEEEPSEEESTERIIEEEKPEGEIIGEEPTEEAPTEEELTEEEHPVEEVTTEEIMGVTFKSNDIAHGVDGDMAWAIDKDGFFVAKGQIDSVVDKSTGSHVTPWHDYAKQITSADFAVVSNDYFYCFCDCENMTEVKLDFGDYDEQNIKSTAEMFLYCRSLEKIDLSGLNTSKVEDMYQMFEGCTSLTALDISSFDVSSLRSAWSMFAGCEKLEDLNLGDFETKKLIHFAGMFSGCKALKQIDLSKCTYGGVVNSYNNNFDGSEVDLGGTFYGCSNLESVDLSGLSNCCIFTLDKCFEDCTSLKSVKFGNNLIMTGPATCSTFINCSSLEEVDLSGFSIFSSNDDLGSTSEAVDVKWYANFKGCTSLKKIVTPQNLFKYSNGGLYLP